MSKSKGRVVRKNTTAFFSKDGTKPYNELTESERIAEGSRQPFVQKYDFSKTKEERELISRLKRRSVERVSESGIASKRFEVESRLTVHVRPKAGDNKTTFSVMLKPSEVNTYMKNNFVTKGFKITKATYNGSILKRNGQKKSA